MTMKSILKIFAVTLLAMLCLGNQVYAGNAMHIVINDHLGTPQMLVDENRSVVWQAEYDEFGKANILVQQVEFNQRFPGQYYDKETGLHYNYYRDYDPSTGRYVQSDPIGILMNFDDPVMMVPMELGVPLNKGGILFGGFNSLYGYAGQNSVMLTDAFGLCAGPLAFLYPVCAAGAAAINLAFQTCVKSPLLCTSAGAIATGMGISEQLDELSECEKDCEKDHASCDDNGDTSHITRCKAECYMKVFGEEPMQSPLPDRM